LQVLHWTEDSTPFGLKFGRRARQSEFASGDLKKNAVHLTLPGWSWNYRPRLLMAKPMSERTIAKKFTSWISGRLDDWPRKTAYYDVLKIASSTKTLLYNKWIFLLGLEH
jgi:hypothetical protein